nr:DUF2807 domain-containing protein [Pseudomonas aeruginosa]
MDVEVTGSGDVDASEIVAMTVELSVAGSGDIDAYVTQSVTTRVAGSGDIVVRDNPFRCRLRRHQVQEEVGMTSCVWPARSSRALSLPR